MMGQVRSIAYRCGSRGSFALLQSLRPGSGFNRSSKLKVRAARGCAASPDTDGLRIPSRDSRVSSVRCVGAGSKLACAPAAVDKRAARAGSAAACYGPAAVADTGTAAYRPRRRAQPRVASPTHIGLPDVSRAGNQFSNRLNGYSARGAMEDL